jgi:hypothetical protein
MAGQCSWSPSQPIMMAGASSQARLCYSDFGIAPGACSDPSGFCTIAKAPGFSLCVINDGDMACPEGWPNKTIVYLDAGECNCTCGPATGERCSWTLSFYQDSACSDLIRQVSVSSDQGPVCIDLPSGTPLLGKAATPPAYQAGTCKPMALPNSAPTTVCCLP